MSEPKKSWADEVEKEEKEVADKLGKVEITNADSKENDDTPIVRVPGLSRGGKLEIEQGDENSPLHSVKSFDQLGLSKELLDGIYLMEFNKPSKIQEAALPILLGNPPKNLIAQSQSGTGKTGAFVLAMLSKADANIKEPQCLCVVPTRELARQNVKVIQTMGKFTKLQTTLVVKDEQFPSKLESQIIVGTPGKLLDLATKRIINMKKIKVFVLDEADIMMDTAGLGEQTIKLKKLLSPNCQFLLFSATYKEAVRNFANRVVPPPVVNIRLKRKELTLEGIQQLYIDCKSEANKFKVLSDLYGYLTIAQSIIFVHTRKTATDLTNKMRAAGHVVSLLHGGEDMTSQERDKVIDDFREGKTKVLITTNVLARGIDILQVMLVINYDLPVDEKAQPEPSTYLHRIGRSGRFGRKGIAINFVHDEVSRAQIRQLESFLQKPIREFPANKIEDLEEMLEAIRQHDRQLHAMKDKGEAVEEEEDE